MGHVPETVIDRMKKVRHVPETGGRKFGQYPECGTPSVACEGEPTKSGYLNFDPGEMSTINWRKLYQESDSNRDSIGKTKRSTKEIVVIPQETCPSNCQVKVLSACQPMCQVPKILNS